MTVISSAVSSTTPAGSTDLLSDPRLWRASSPLVASAGMNNPATGQAVLDANLAGSGWPLGAVTELIHGPEGVGELGLLLPLLAQLTSTEHKWVAWVAPPHMPCGPTLAAAGVNVERLLLIHPKDHQQTLWCLEQALKSGTCSAVLGWPDPHKLQPKEIRRLQLAARQGGTIAVLFRPETAAETGSPAELRLHLRPGEVRILKRQGGWATNWLPLTGDLGNRRDQGQRTRQCRLRDQLTLWRHQRPDSTTLSPLPSHERPTAPAPQRPLQPSAAPPAPPPATPSATSPVTPVAGAIH